jgi:hypothetical protein
MQQTVSRILKSNQIKVDGKMRLDLVNSPAASQKSGGSNVNNVNSNNLQTDPQVRIVDSQSSFAVIEITCSCGEKIFLKCQYAQT